MARPSKLSAEVQQRICQAIRAGNYAEPAARSAGISPATHYRWMAAGKKATRGRNREYYEAVSKAEADAEVEAVALLRKAMHDDPRHIVSYLERRYPQRWRRHSSHELTGQDGGPVRIADAMFDDPETRRALRETLKRASRLRSDQPGRASAGDEQGI